MKFESKVAVHYGLWANCTQLWPLKTENIHYWIVCCVCVFIIIILLFLFLLFWLIFFMIYLLISNYSDYSVTLYFHEVPNSCLLLYQFIFNQSWAPLIDSLIVSFYVYFNYAFLLINFSQKHSLNDDYCHSNKLPPAKWVSTPSTTTTTTGVSHNWLSATRVSRAASNLHSGASTTSYNYYYYHKHGKPW